MSTPEPPAAGRPRDPAIDTAVLEATRELLAREGYSRMSVEAVARRAGVSKPTIYRRWPGKESLAVAALAEIQAGEPPPATGDHFDDLVAQLENFRVSASRPNGMAMIGTVLVEERHNAELMRQFRASIVTWRHEAVLEVLRSARGAGLIDEHADLEIATGLAIGSFFHQYLATGVVPSDWAERAASTLWSGLAVR